jgi:S1-C subfamily serine protease
VIKAQGVSGLTPATIGSSTKIQVGEDVIAIGSPFGLEATVTRGIVSALNRPVSVGSSDESQVPGATTAQDTTYPAIQTDAAINPGNSGGPLVGSDGRVIGINQQIETKSGGGEGVGFAVPIDVIKRSLDQLRANGAAHYAYLGVVSVPLYPQLVDHFKLDVQNGAWVQEVNPGGPAEQAGLKGGTGDAQFQASGYRRGGDVITKVGGTPITGSDDLSGAVARFKPGEKVAIEVRRGGSTRTLQVKLGERPLGNPARSGG